VPPKKWFKDEDRLRVVVHDSYNKNPAEQAKLGKRFNFLRLQAMLSEGVF
jgi:hypothetical protein